MQLYSAVSDLKLDCGNSDHSFSSSKVPVTSHQPTEGTLAPARTTAPDHIPCGGLAPKPKGFILSSTFYILLETHWCVLCLSWSNEEWFFFFFYTFVVLIYTFVIKSWILPAVILKKKIYFCLVLGLYKPIQLNVGRSIQYLICLGCVFR